MSNSNTTKTHQKELLLQKEYYGDEEAVFENSPRPPIPGEEQRTLMVDCNPEIVKQQQQQQQKQQKFAEDSKFFKATPNTSRNIKKSSNSCFVEEHQQFASSSSSSSSNLFSSSASNHTNFNNYRPSMDLPTATATENKLPVSSNCLQWAESLHSLIQDPDGVKLFRQYLESEGKQQSDPLDFWFACEGLRRQQAPDKIMHLVKLIYNKFLRKSTLSVPEDVRQEIVAIVKSSQCLDPPVTLFDTMQAQIEHLIQITTYPNFIKSEIYLQHANEFIQNARTSTDITADDCSNSNNTECPVFINSVDPLPTLHEDAELIMDSPSHLDHAFGSVSTGYHTPNSKSTSPVRLTRDILLLSQKRRAVDRSKSETFVRQHFAYGSPFGVQALYNHFNPVSRQDSELHSLSSHSDIRTDSDNRSINDRPSMQQLARRQMKINREVNLDLKVIPRTQTFAQAELPPKDPHEFALILTKKLEMIKKEQDAGVLLYKKLSESKPSSDQNIATKFLMDDESTDQSILDDHVSLVFPDTPVRSPGINSPYKNRNNGQSIKRRKDQSSMFSIDSGNGPDSKESFDHHKNAAAMSKSKSMFEYAEEQRFLRGGGGNIGKKSISINTLNTDSGISVVSDNKRIVPDKYTQNCAGRDAQHDFYVKQRSGANYNKTSNPTSSISGKTKKESRSNCTESSSSTIIAGGGQPTSSSESSTLSNMEEVKRKLVEVELKSKQRSSGRHYPELVSQSSSQSTLKKPQGLKSSAAVVEELTIAIYTFCEEEVKYRTKIPGTRITLKQFKEYLPKKGNYRYFFKTVCEDLDNDVVQEEISNDNDILPLFGGKIMAQVKQPID